MKIEQQILLSGFDAVSHRYLKGSMDQYYWLMLGGINNGLFFQGLSGFAVIVIFAAILRWIFDSPSTKAARLKRRADKKSLRRLKRK